MRVLHLVKTATGAVWALRQMTELARLGIEVHACLPEGPLVERYRDAGIRVHLLQTDFPMRRPWRWPALAGALRALVREARPDLLHSHFVGTTLTMRLALKGLGLPRLFQVPGPLHLEHALYRHGELAVADGDDAWIGACRWTCERYRAAGIPAQRVFLSYHGTDTAAFVPGPATGALRRELGLGPDARLVGMVAFLYAPKWYLGQRRGIKGHEDLIDALAILRERGADMHGVFVGGAWGRGQAYEARVRAYAQRRLGAAAHFLGTRGDVAQLYHEFEVAVHPSHSENVGGAVESLLMGIPTIATRVGGFPDLVADGETGWLVPPRAPAALAEAIAAALADPGRAAALARHGRERASSQFDIRRLAAEVRGIYQTVLERRPAGAGAP
jgi:glycosyltransferase involved in cell wall biosynthesis